MAKASAFVLNMFEDLVQTHVLIFFESRVRVRPALLRCFQLVDELPAGTTKAQCSWCLNMFPNRQIPKIY